MSELRLIQGSFGPPYPYQQDARVSGQAGATETLQKASERLERERKSRTAPETFEQHDNFYALKEKRPRLYALMNEAAGLALSKGSDYNEGAEDFGNLRECVSIGIPAWKGVLVRILDKITRFKSFANKGAFAVADEKFRDTAIDLSNYALLMAALFEEENS